MKEGKDKVYEFGLFRLTEQDRQLWKNDKLIYISHKRFEILLFLLKNQGITISKREILDRCWSEKHVEQFNISQHIYEIRKILKKNGGDETYIETIPKYGYRFVKEVKIRETASNKKSEIENFASIHKTIGTTEELSKKGVSDISSETINVYSNSKKKKWFFLNNLNGLKKGFLGAAILAVFLFSLVGIYTQFFVKKQTGENRKIKSIAILPFKQIENSSNGKWELGIADSLITELGNQKQILISPTASIIRFADKENFDPIEVGETLGVDAVLIGTIQKDNKIVRVNVQCIDIRENSPIWSEKFDLSFSNIFSLQDKVSKHLAQRLSINFIPRQKLEAENTKDIEAYKAYSMGLFHSSKLFNFSKPSLINPDEIINTIKYFEKAIEKDPEFSRAYAKLAKTYVFMGVYDFGLSMTRNEVFSKAKKHADKALELNPNSSDAYAVLGELQLNEGNLLKSRNLLEKALDLQPHNIEANTSFGWLEAIEGNWEEAIQKMKNANQANPHNKELSMYLARFLLLTRKPDEALSIVKRELELKPPSVRTNIYLARILEFKGELDNAVKELKLVLEKEPNNLLALVMLSRIYAKKGETQKARNMLNQELKGLEKQFGKDYSDYFVALAYLHLGEKKETLDIIQKLKANYHLLIILRHDYNFDSIRNTEEFQLTLFRMERELNLNS